MKAGLRKGEIEAGLERESGLEAVASVEMANQMIGRVQHAYPAIKGAFLLA